MKYCLICTYILDSKIHLDLCTKCVNALTDPSIKGRVKNTQVGDAVRSMVTASLREARAAAHDAETANEMVAELQARSQGL